MTPKARPFCDRQVGELRECTNRRRNTWFPAPRSPSALTSGPQPSAAPTGWRSLGTQERTKWVFPASVETPESTTGKPSPSPPRANPATTGPPPLAPGFAPPLPRSRRVPSRSGDPREHNWDRPPPTAIVISTRAAGVYPAPVRSRRVSSRSGHFREHYWDCFPPPPDRKTAPRRPVSPRPCLAPGTFPAAVGTPESTTGTASHPLPTGNPPRAALFRPAPARLPVPYQFLAFTPG